MKIQQNAQLLGGVIGIVLAGCSEPRSTEPADSIPLTLVVLASAETQPSTPRVNWDVDGTLHVDDSIIAVKSRGQTQVADSEVHKWIGTAAHAISTYYGRSPVRRATIEVIASRDGKVHGGVTYEGKLIRIHLGRDTRPADLADDWMITHEMYHLAFPDLDDSYSWMEEGMADYLEPLARARIGTLTPEQVWSGYVEGMPKGQPEKGDKGLDHTHTWGRTYWGGAIFWLLADVRVREETGNRRSIDDAFRTILDAGGDGSVHWSLDKVIEVGDRATGTTVLKKLHDEMGEKPVVIDLDGLWARLGVVQRGKHITFDNTAPLAAIRQSITNKRTAGNDAPK
jgi:hypothetical protein